MNFCTQPLLSATFGNVDHVELTLSTASQSEART